MIKLSLAPGGHLFLCADPNQGFLRSRLSWKRAGLDVAGRTKKLRNAYRTTRAMLEAAHQVLSGATSDDPEEFLRPDYSHMEMGAPPVLLQVASAQDAVDRVANEITAATRPWTPRRSGKGARRYPEAWSPKCRATAAPERAYCGARSTLDHQGMFMQLSKLALAALLLTTASEAPAFAQVGTWAPLARAVPAGGNTRSEVESTLLLTDGSVIANVVVINGDLSPRWFRLTPDSTGDYRNGTWSEIASMRDTRQFNFSVVLGDGRVLVGGGEYGTGTNTVELYDPVANVWSVVNSWTNGDIGDSDAVVLDDGRVLVLPRHAKVGWIYDVHADTWMATPNRLGGQTNSEASFVHLPGGDVLVADVGDAPNAQRYSPGLNQWLSAGVVPVNLVDSKAEIGPGLVLYDGRTLFLGATGQTALYTAPTTGTGTGSWVAGPIIPNGKVTDDAPGVVLPNGRVLFAADAGGLYSPPSTLFEFDPVTNLMTQVPPPSLDFINASAFTNRMLLLPSGQVLLSNPWASPVFIYTPSPGTNDAWRPTISSVTDNGDGSFTLVGTQLNGLTEGASFGDDAQMASNYPLVRIVDANARVQWARTFDHSTCGVATGSAVVSTNFRVPSLANGSYTLSVVANGIVSSQAVPFNLSRPTAAPTITSSPPSPLIAYVDRPFVYRAVATGSPAPVFSLAAGPADMTIDPTTGYLSFDATTPLGSVPVTIVASNGVGPDATQSFVLSVRPNPGTFDIFVQGNLHDGQVLEGDSGKKTVTFTVTRTGGTGGAVSVQAWLMGTLAGNATNDEDFKGHTIRGLSWADGDDQPKTFTIDVYGDTEIEATEYLSYGLTNQTGGALVAPNRRATLHIVADDLGPGGRLGLSAIEYSIPEGDTGTSVATITVERTGGSVGEVSVQIFPGLIQGVYGTATNNVDYTAPAIRTLRWADGDTQPKTFKITVIGDDDPEANETVRVGLINLAGNAVLGLDIATLTIVNDD